MSHRKSSSCGMIVAMYSHGDISNEVLDNHLRRQLRHFPTNRHVGLPLWAVLKQNLQPPESFITFPLSSTDIALNSSHILVRQEEFGCMRQLLLGWITRPPLPPPLLPPPPFPEPPLPPPMCPLMSLRRPWDSLGVLLPEFFSSNIFSAFFCSSNKNLNNDSDLWLQDFEDPPLVTLTLSDFLSLSFIFLLCQCVRISKGLFPSSIHTV